MELARQVLKKKSMTLLFTIILTSKMLITRFKILPMLVSEIKYRGLILRVTSQALDSDDLNLDQSAKSIQILPEPNAVTWHAFYKITTLLCTLNSRNVLIHLLTISFPNPKRVLKRIRDKDLISLHTILSFLKGSGVISASTYLRTFTN